MPSVLVTGANGFLAVHIIQTLLDKGYDVVGTVRSESKTPYLRERFKTDRLQFAIVPDITAAGAFDQILRDNDFIAVLHTSGPVTFDVQDVDKELYQPVIRSTLELLGSVKQYAPNVVRVVLTSSFTAIIDMFKGNNPGHTYTDDDWNPAKAEDGLSNTRVGYFISKKLEEEAAWDWMKANDPHFSLTAICPPWVFGPPLQELRSLDELNMSTSILYKVFNGTAPPNRDVFIWSDARDVALAHVLAFERPQAANQRYLITAGSYSAQQQLDYIWKHHPERAQKYNITKGDPEHPYPEGGVYGADNSKSIRDLGLVYRDFDTMQKDTYARFEELEKEGKGSCRHVVERLGCPNPRRPTSRPLLLFEEKASSLSIIMHRPAVGNASGPHTPALKRNQACHQCRKRKMKCDALMPCGPCAKLQLKSDPNSTASILECTYDDPDEVAEGPKGKIARLEAEIAELRQLLEQRNAELASCVCGARSSAAASTSRTVVSSSPESCFPENAGVTSTPGVPSVFPPNPATLDSSQLQVDILNDPPQTTPDLQTAFPVGGWQLIDGAWPINVPPPDLLYHLVDTFFACAPLAHWVLHRPTFMLHLLQGPSSPNFPHIALLHAICAMGSLYTPVIEDKPPNLNYWKGATASFNSGIILTKEGEKGGDKYFPRRVEDMMAVEEGGFGTAQLRWCAAVFRLALLKGDRLLQLVQASVISAWYAHSRGKSANAFAWVQMASKTALPLGLNVSEGFESLSRLPPKALTLLPEASTPTEAEQHRNVFWLIYSLERIYTSGTVWPLQYTDDICSQIMPCRLTDFTSGSIVPTQGRQKLFTLNMLLTHPPLLTDSFTLYIKASSLLGRVKYFNLRYRIRAAEVQAKDNDTSAGRGNASSNPRDTREFQDLDQLIRDFTGSFPSDFKNPDGGDERKKFDPVLYTAHLLPQAAIILLHDPHADILSGWCPSAPRLFEACRNILNLVYQLLATTFDPLYLDHACCICWFIAGATMTRFVKAMKETGNTEGADRITQDIGVIKFMLNNLGERTRIGVRQAMLLDEIYESEVGPYGGPWSGGTSHAYVSEVFGPYA